MSQSPNPAAPQQVAPLLALATQLLRAGRPADAIAPLRDAALLQPSNPIIQHDLGLACLEVGRVPDAIAALQRAVASNPRYADAHFRLGIALEKLGDIGGAIAAYDRATKLLPSLTEAWFRAGALVYTLGHRDEAIGCFRRAAATGGRNSFGRLGKARALLTEDRNQEAEQVLRETLVADPRNAMAYDLLGNLLSEFGRFDEARACFERAIAIAPLLAGSYYELVRCRPVTSDDDGLLQRCKPPWPRRDWKRGNACGFTSRSARRRRILATTPWPCSISTPQTRAPGLCAVRLGRVLHRDRPPDCPLHTRMDRARARTRQRGCDAGADHRHAAVRHNSGRADRLHASRGRGRRRVAFLEPARGGVAPLRLRARPGTRRRFSRSSWPRRRQTISAVLRAIAPKAARVTDKMPFNFLWAGLIHVAFPRATIIHCRRAAIDTALSIHQTHFRPGLAFPTGGAELVAYFHDYQRLIDHWRSVLPADRFIEVDYEDLTRAPEPVIRRIIAACGLAWHDKCLRPESNPRAVNTPSKWQARQPIYRTSVARWRRYEPWLGPLRALVEVKVEVK
jgi:tetratricopeptide (TPR) repeat protein